jgi:DNA polymerase-3 subunit alpha
VIGDRPLTELVPLYRDPRSDMPVTQFNMKWVEPAGLVKFDFLGLKTLTVHRQGREDLINARGGRSSTRDMPARRQRPTNDGPGRHGRGVPAGRPGHARHPAQDEARPLRGHHRAVALYRPGPMENIPTYIAASTARRSRIDYLHPMLEPILKETYGVIIYQEQVMQIAQVLAGYSLGEADLLRRAMGKKIKAEMDAQRGALRRGRRSEQRREAGQGLADTIFDLVAKFAGYGFNKSHAAAYALVSLPDGLSEGQLPGRVLRRLDDARHGQARTSPEPSSASCSANS